MEKRLKKERRKLLLRIILIILPCWLIVSALFCIFRINMETSRAKNDGFKAMSRFTTALAEAKGSEDSIKTTLANTKELFYQNKNLNRQLTISSQNEEIVYFDSGCTVSLTFRIQRDNTRSEDITAQIDYRTITSALTEEELHEIKTYLNEKRNDGNYYELDCTKLQQIGPDLAKKEIPLELTLVLVNGKDPTALIDSHVKTYTLDENKNDAYTIYDSSETIMDNVVKRNVIPKDFLFGGKYYKPLLEGLTPKQRRQSNELFQQTNNYLYYANAYVPYGQNNTWLVEYAQTVDVVDNCKHELIFGVAALFVFFLMVAGFLYIMIWKVVKIELLMEQRRLDLTNALAHDTKTPLFVISGYAYSLKEDIDEKERDLYLEKIIEQTDEANGLVHRMLKFSKLDSYKMTLNKTDFDLYELTEAVLQNYTVLSNNKKMVLTHSGNNLVNADKELIKTVLQNLTDNAVKYAFPDSKIKIKISGKAFSISNQTEPLTKEELKELQMPYMQRDKSRSQKGNGLGLSIVNSILELHKAPFDVKMKNNTLTCSFKL